MADEEPPPPAEEEAPPPESEEAPPPEASPPEEPPAEGGEGISGEEKPVEDGAEVSTEVIPPEQPEGDAGERTGDGEIPDEQTVADETAEAAAEEGAIDEVNKEVEEVKDLKASIMTLTKVDSDTSQASEYSMKEEQRKKMRSKGKAMGSIISIRRGSAAGDYYDRQKGPKFMNSYKLDSDKPFNIEKVEEILKDVLIEALDNLTYDTDKCPKQAKWASSAIRAKVKEQEYDRYKIICLVTIGEKRSQDVYSIFRFLWDAERDKFAKYTHENMFVFAIALCFGVYYE